MPESIGQRTTSNDAIATVRSMRGGSPARTRGLAAPQIIVIIGVIALLAIAAWWFMGRSGPAAPGTTTPTASTGATPDAAEIPAPEAGAAELTVDQLYKEARSAMSDNRMVAPAGKNALEYYLRIVAKQPDDTGAKDALREMFPFATAGVEDQINQGNFDEAARIMALLAKADPSNYTLTILRSKLDLKKKQNDRDLAQKAAQDAATAAAAARGAQAPAAATGTTPATAETSAAPAGGTATPVAATPAAEAAPKPTEVAKATPPPAPVAPPAGESHEVSVLTPPRPSYPPAAVRNRQDGWVEVEFTVAADGSVQNAHVTASEPARVFDREAVSAVQRAKFSPKMENGQAVASTLRRRIEFKLGN